jgi:hypothetical protein
MTHATDSLDPFVKKMREAETDAGRALVLLEAPVFTLMRWRDVFETVCRRAQFEEGRIYLDELRAAMAGPRHRGIIGGSMPLAGATTTLLGVVERAGRTGMLTGEEA